MAEQVLVFKKKLFPDLPKTGFTYDAHILSEILPVTEFIDRGKAEHDVSYTQIIPYSIMRYNQSVLRYKRSAWGGEARLHGLYSIGVGGHINKSDVLPLWSDVTSVIEWARDRELEEEFCVEHSGQPHLVGLLNDDSDVVGRFHLGVVYEYWLTNPQVTVKEKRVHLQYILAPLQDLLADIQKYESWSRILIKQYLCQMVHRT